MSTQVSCAASRTAEEDAFWIRVRGMRLDRIGRSRVGDALGDARRVILQAADIRNVSFYLRNVMESVVKYVARDLVPTIVSYIPYERIPIARPSFFLRSSTPCIASILSEGGALARISRAFTRIINHYREERENSPEKMLRFFCDLFYLLQPTEQEGGSSAVIQLLRSDAMNQLCVKKIVDFIGRSLAKPFYRRNEKDLQALVNDYVALYGFFSRRVPEVVKAEIMERARRSYAPIFIITRTECCLWFRHRSYKKWVRDRVEHTELSSLDGRCSARERLLSELGYLPPISSTEHLRSFL